MPRAARMKSKTGIYHVIAKGIDRQAIFQDEEDGNTYISRLSGYKTECGFSLYAYCLMSNHVHLLIQESETAISEIMKRLNTSYAYWFNWKYNRIGHLFQDRFKSEPVEDDRYLLSLVRYIHQNPVKIGLSMSSLTSYNDYISGSSGYGMTDTAYVLSMLSENTTNAKEMFMRYMNEQGNEKFLDTEGKRRITDGEASKMIREICDVANCLQLRDIEKETRDRILRKLREKGLSTRQIERLTGISRGVVLKA